MTESQIQPFTISAGIQDKMVFLTFKRIFDFNIALLLLVLLLPLLVLIALSILIQSGPPIFFTQKRIGRGGQEFTLYKFRTMRTLDTHKFNAQIKTFESSGLLYKQSTDPRISRIGKMLRRYSLDELPQLLNVLRGDMSMVGPRPLLSFMLDPYPEFKAARSLICPGITGLWQIRARHQNSSALFMLNHDLEYIQKMGLGLDLKILLATPAVVWGGLGAC
jgi:exopolysaccharide production protein ExoY